MKSLNRKMIIAILAAGLRSVVPAAVTLTSPADYATVSTMTSTFKADRLKSSFIAASTYSSKDTTARKSMSSEYKANSVPVTLAWSGASGACTVTVRRAADNAVVYTATTGESSLKFCDAEIGRNYVWTVSDASGSATGHFYTERNAPRAINARELGNGHVDNARDLGGVTNTAGKVVKQGLVYRTRQFDWCAELWDEEVENPPHPTNVWHGVDSDGDPTESIVYADSDGYPCIPYWRDGLGIRLDVDLREIDGSDGVRSCMAEYGSTLATSPIGRSVRRFFTEQACGRPFGWNGTQGASGTGLITDSVARNTFYHVFTNFTDAANYPIVFHCAHGKDRTGFLAMVLYGLLDVPLDTIKRDYCCAFYAVSSYKTSSIAINGYQTSFSTRYGAAAGSKLSNQIAAYVTEAYTDAGRTAQEAAADIAAFKARMLEDPESPAVAPGADDGDVDTFRYVDYYFRRTAGGGSWDSGQVYWFKDLNDGHNWPGGANPSAFENCYYFQPTASKRYAFPASMKVNAGKVVVNSQYAATEYPATDNHCVGAYGFKPVFTSAGHTNRYGAAISDRTVWEFRHGNGNFQNTDVYVSDFAGTGSIDVWAGATFQGTDFTVTTDAKSRIYLRFPKGNCADAGVHFYYDDKAENSLGWFTGGEAGTCQRIILDNCRFALKASGKTSQVEGALDITLKLGDQTLTSSAAMLSSVATLVVNAGSSLTVDAGQKAAGTYKLISAATLTDNADLTQNNTISNCLAGTFGRVTRSGQTLSLVIEDAPVVPGKIEIAVPVAVTGFFENGEEHTGVTAGEGYVLSGVTSASAAGDYVATAALEDGYCWVGGSEEPQDIHWTIAAANHHGLYRYLCTDATGYIKTTYVPNTARTIVEIKVQYLNRVGDNSLFCANGFTGNQGKWGNPYQLFNEGDATYQGSGVADWIEICTGEFTDTEEEHVFRVCRNTLTIDGTEYAADDQPKDEAASGPLVLFAWCGKNDKYSYLGEKKIAYVKIWEIQQSGATNLVYDLVPALDTADKATLYNRVDNTCLSSQNASGYTVLRPVPAEQPEIGGTGGVVTEATADAFRVRIRKAHAGYTYSCRWTTDLSTPPEEWNREEIDPSSFEVVDGETVLSLPKGTDPCRFYRVTAE